MKVRNAVRLAALLASSFGAFAATSTSWQLSGFTDFSKGKISGLSLTSDGLLQPGPAVRAHVTLNQPAAWSIAPDGNGGFYVATGHGGAVLRVAADGSFSPLWSASQAEVFALCAGANGAVIAGTSPNGGVYRIENGKAREIWHSTAKYIWALTCAGDGTVYAGTGEGGRVYRIAPDGRADLYYETGQVNVTALKLGPAGHLYAGTDPNGLVYDITAPKTAAILYDSPLPEIRSIASAPDGTIYVAAMGGAISTRSGTPASTAAGGVTPTVTATTPTVITVTAEAAESAAASPPAAQAPSSTSSSASSTSTAAAVTEVSGVDKSAIYKISPDHAVETLRTSKDENIYDLVLDGAAIYYCTDVRGRIYRLDGRRTTLVTELGDGTATRLTAGGGSMFAVLSNPARAYFLSASSRAQGAFESQVHDATSVARWGHLQWHGSGTGLEIETRTGYSARPDGTWSKWAAVATGSALIQSPVARFIQTRVVWPPDSSAVLDTLIVPYLPRNNPPAVHSISVSSVLNQNTTKSAGATSAAANAPYSVTVTDTGEAPAASSSNSASQTASHLQSTQTQISWQADDPDGDKLAYSVYFRAEDESQWQLVRSRMFENTLLLDPDVFADGRYFFRVVATDAPANSPEFAQESELVSTPVVIDNTPPEVTLGPAKREGAVLDLDVHAVDATSPLRLCEYSLDAGGWQPIEAVDGVTDSPRESFHLHLDKLRPGEHLLVIRVYDAVNNAGLAKVVLH